MNTQRHPWATYGLIMAGSYCAFRMLRTAVRTQSLRGRIVLITGGSKGLGMILARDFALAGARVAICAPGVDELETARSCIYKEAAAAILAVPCDVSQRDEVDRMMRHIHRVYGPIDILVNSACPPGAAPLCSVLYPMLAVLPSMQEKQSGLIINIAANGALIDMPLDLLKQMKSQGITVTSIRPSLPRTTASLPLISPSTERAARKIMRAVVNEDYKRLRARKGLRHAAPESYQT